METALKQIENLKSIKLDALKMKEVTQLFNSLNGKTFKGIETGDKVKFLKVAIPNEILKLKKALALNLEIDGLQMKGTGVESNGVESNGVESNGVESNGVVNNTSKVEGFNFVIPEKPVRSPKPEKLTLKGEFDLLQKIGIEALKLRSKDHLICVGAFFTAQGNERKMWINCKGASQFAKKDVVELVFSSGSKDANGKFLVTKIEGYVFGSFRAATNFGELEHGANLLS